MSEPDEQRLETLRWIEYATEDLASARHVVEDDGVSPRVVCLLAQQAAEKIIKAALIALQVPFPFIHDLDVLKTLAPEEWSATHGTGNLSELTRWAIQSRYPTEFPRPSRDDARHATAIAAAVFEAVVGDGYRIVPGMGFGDDAATSDTDR